MTLQMVPLTTAPNQNFTVNLSVDGSPLTLNLTVSFNEMAGYWILSISNSANDLLIDSVPMLTGGYPAANLLQQQRYLGIGSWFIVNVSNIVATIGGETGYGEGGYGMGPYGGVNGEGGMDYPNSTNLGTDFQLWVGDTPTV
jgi:hypothetical protein